MSTAPNVFCCVVFATPRDLTFMATELKLFIYVIGIGGSSFSVTIQSSKTVDDLKKAIKEEKKPRLDHIAADELTLYKVSIPDGKNLEQSAQQAIREAPELDVSSRQLFKQSEKRRLASSLHSPTGLGRVMSECVRSLNHRLTDKSSLPFLNLFFDALISS